MISLQRVNAKAGSFRLTDVTFDVPQGSYGVVIGPAGSGKTTLLETVAGVVKTTSGRIMLGGEDLTAAPPERRRLGIVYQHAFLFPHLSVQQNVVYGALSESIAADVAERFAVTDFYERPVASLSGGERQLVAIEVVKPLGPRDRPETGDAWKVEADSGAAVRHPQCRRARRSRFAGRGFGVVPFRPPLDDAVILGRKRTQLGTRGSSIGPRGETVSTRDHGVFQFHDEV